MRLRVSPLSVTAWLVALGGPLLALWVVFFPELRHYWVPRGGVSADVRARVADSQRIPLIAELSRTDLGPFAARPDADIVRMAESLARGEPALGDTNTRLDPKFASSDLVVAASAIQLDVASLVVPDLYLRAARISGKREYMELAASYLRNWWRYERGSWLPVGLQWNDHALAARAFVLSRYWVAVQAREEGVGSDNDWVIDALAATAAHLAKPESFTFRTNHGVMQTLALLHVAICFPELPRGAEYLEIARERLAQQLDWYLSPEGVVLEHSAGYHVFGVDLLRKAKRYFDVAQLQAPPRLTENLQGAQDFAMALLRPDGTLPPLGDTIRAELADPGFYTQLAASGVEPPQFVFAPVSGYAVYRQGSQVGSAGEQDVSQLVATWSHYATEAHRHSDDLSFTLFSHGGDWLVASGYWPYDSPQRSVAVGWAGANAPHEKDEPLPSPQSSAVAGHAVQGPLAALDLVRAGAHGIQYRRQIVQLGNSIWLVFDSTTPGNVSIETVWTIDPKLVLNRATGPGPGLILSSADGRRGALILLSGSPAFRADIVHGGSRFPAGWTAADGQPTRTISFVTSAPAGSYAATLIDTAIGTGTTLAARVHWTSAEEWHAEYRRGASEYTIERRANAITIHGPVRSRALATLALTRPDPQVETERTQIDARYLAARAAAGRYNETYLPYRFLAARFIGLGALATAAGLLLLGAARRRNRISSGVLWGACIVAAAGWCGLAAWLQWAYFG